MVAEKRESRVIALLWWLMVIFQAGTMVYLGYREAEVNQTALIYAAAMPVVSWLIYAIAYKGCKVDGILLLLVMFLCSVSLAILTRNQDSAMYNIKQAAYMAVGMVGMLAAIWFAGYLEKWNTRVIGGIAAVGAVAMIVPRVFPAVYGAYNWISLGPVSVQPSEFVKVFLPIMMAHFSVKRGTGGSIWMGRRGWLNAGLAVAVMYCGILAVVQKDLGTMLVYGAAALVMYFIGGGTTKATVGLMGGAFICAVILYVIEPRVQHRVSAFLDPYGDTSTLSDQVKNSMSALGSSGFMGRGFGQGASYKIILAESDCAFVAVCEEFGMLFGILLIGIYMLLSWRAFTIGCRAASKFRRVVCTGIGASIAFQSMIIIGGSTNLIPLTGVTLPFISYGGSSLISGLFAIGILLRYSAAERPKGVVTKKVFIH